MKKKILSLVMCVCVAFGCLFSFAGCSTVKNNNTASDNQIILTVNGETIDKSAVLGSFYNFLYGNYSLIYGGAESSVIQEKFYNDLIKNKIIMIEANKVLGTDIIYGEEDEKDVWDSVKTYFRGQVDSYEKELYDNDESKYPVWLQTVTPPTEDEKFESYEDPSIQEDESKESVDKLTKEDIEAEDDLGNSKYKEIFNAMFEYVSHIELDEEGEQIYHYEVIVDQEGSESRRTAYSKYVEDLIFSAQAEGRIATEKELLLESIVEIYDSYYEAKIAELYQIYIEKELVLDAEELKPESIAKLFLESLNSDKQNNLNESNYISVITNSETELVLYHNNDKFFTVQHILLKFDDKLIKDIQEEYLYVDMSSKDMQLEDFENFVEKRNDLVEDYYGIYGVLTDVNEKQLDEMPTLKGLMAQGVNYDYYSYSEESGYQKVDSKENGKMMVTADQIISIYDAYLRKVNQSVEAVKFDDAELVNQPEEIQYILKTVLTLIEAGENAGKTEDEINAEISKKVSSMVFYALSWAFSDDGLYNTIYKQLGYVMANYPDENNNFSHEFVDLSKDIFNAIKEGKSNIQDLFRMVDGNKVNNLVITKDGLHLIKLDNVFEKGASLIDVSDIDVSNTDAVINLMKQTYICNGSDQTVYDYYRDLIYNKLSGDDKTNGMFFEDYKNQLLKKYLEEEKVEYNNIISYEEIMSSIY